MAFIWSLRELLSSYNFQGVKEYASEQLVVLNEYQRELSLMTDAELKETLRSLCASAGIRSPSTFLLPELRRLHARISEFERRKVILWPHFVPSSAQQLLEISFDYHTNFCTSILTKRLANRKSPQLR